MKISLSQEPAAHSDADWLIVTLSEAKTLAGPLAELDLALGGLLNKLITAGDITGKHCELVPLLSPAGISARRLLVVGLGADAKATPALFEQALTAAARKLADKRWSHVAILLPDASSLPLSTEKLVELAASAVLVGSAGPGLYRKEANRFEFDAVSLILPQTTRTNSFKPAVERGRVVGEAVNLTRELVNRAPNDIYPRTFAKVASKLADEHNLECEIWNRKKLRKENMRALLAVASGSNRPPRLVILSHTKAPKDAPVLALVGKGVTFDSGGLTLKPIDGMKTMKCDMAGAATVLAAMVAIARLNLPINVIGLMGLVENMTGGSAYKLGDVITARNGTTIEVMNADAEGRIVLADVLAVAVDRGAHRLVDLATLTGACVIALGDDLTGVFSNNSGWQDSVLAAAKTVGEELWPMPMLENFSEQLSSDVADCKNVGTRSGGAITAAKFLEKFVSGKPWVHLDIAGPAFASSSKAWRDSGGTGALVRTLIEVATNWK